MNSALELVSLVRIRYHRHSQDTCLFLVPLFCHTVCSNQKILFFSTFSVSSYFFFSTSCKPGLISGNLETCANMESEKGERGSAFKEIQTGFAFTCVCVSVCSKTKKETRMKVVRTVIFWSV